MLEETDVHSSLPETSLGVPDFSEIIGKPVEGWRNFVDCVGFPVGLSDFFGRPSALDLSNEPEIN